MSRFIQPLEGRTLLTATSASISAETSAINTAAGAVQADLTALQNASKADLAKINTDLKGSARTNAPLQKKLLKDQTVLIAKIKADTAALLKGTTSSTKAAADGTAVAANPALGGSGKIQADVNTLVKASSSPLTKLTTDADPTTAKADVDALVAANPSLTSLATDGATDKSDLGTNIAKLLADATTYSNSIGTLKTDLTTLLPQPTTTPSLIGDYKGTVRTKGILFGIGAATYDLEIVVTNQTLNTLTGSITVGGNTASGTITVTELTTGKVTMTLNDSGTTITLDGHVNVVPTKTGLGPGSVIFGSGTLSISGFDIKGDFTVTKIT
jgi:hypothetical protein